MPAKSEAQQQAAGIAYAVKKGKLPVSKLKGASKQMVKMSEEDLKHFAKTKRKGLVKKVQKKLDKAFKKKKHG